MRLGDAGAPGMRLPKVFGACRNVAALNIAGLTGKLLLRRHLAGVTERYRPCV